MFTFVLFESCIFFNVISSISFSLPSFSGGASRDAYVLKRRP